MEIFVHKPNPLIPDQEVVDVHANAQYSIADGVLSILSLEAVTLHQPRMIYSQTGWTRITFSEEDAKRAALNTFGR